MKTLSIPRIKIHLKIKKVMKTHLKIIFFICFLQNANCIHAQQQPQWKFHLAFEDATGAKDTIWFVWDSTASFYGIDTVFGEIPINITPDTFQVYLTIPGGYFSNTFATYPYNSFQNNIYAHNYVYPIIIRWDTSLFYSNALISPINCAEMDNSYFFTTSGNFCNVFNMLENDTALCPPFGLEEHFPLSVNINVNEYCCLNGIEENNGNNGEYDIYPNPFGEKLIMVSSKCKVKEIIIYSVDGKKVYQDKNEYPEEKEIRLSLAMLNQGIYIVEIKNDKNQKFYEKIVKFSN